jgi:phenolic acid decarboxylase
MPDELDEDEARTGERMGELIAKLSHVAGRRIHVAIIPARWSDDQAKRLTRLVNFVLEGDGARLYGMECAATALSLDSQGRPQ